MPSEQQRLDGDRATRDRIIQDVAVLIEEARRTKMWLWSRYQNLWFSPDELERHQKEGRFIWSVPNWELRNPLDELKDIDRRTKELMDERDAFARRVYGYEV